MVHLQTVHTILVLAVLAVLMAGLLHLKQKLMRWGKANRKPPV